MAVTTRAELPVGDTITVETGGRIRPVQVFAVLGAIFLSLMMIGCAVMRKAKASHLAIGLTYNLPQAFVGVRSSAWPVDVQKRSYLTNHICGAETDRACPGPGVPLARRGSVFVDPSGNLVVPEGAELRPHHRCRS